MITFIIKLLKVKIKSCVKATEKVEKASMSRLSSLVLDCIGRSDGNKSELLF